MSNTLDIKAILNQLFSKLDNDAKKVLNNWTREVKKKPMVLWVNQTVALAKNGDEKADEEIKQFLVEVDKALEADNWEWFERGAEEGVQPSKGQAVRSADVPSAASDTDDEEEDDEEEDESFPTNVDRGGIKADDSEEEDEDEDEDEYEDDEDDEDEEDEEESDEDESPSAVTKAPVSQPVAPSFDPSNPFAPMIAMIAAQVAAQVKTEIMAELPKQKAGGVTMAEVDKHLRNGGFPASEVIKVWENREIAHIAAYLASHRSDLVARAINVYNNQRANKD